MMRWRPANPVSVPIYRWVLKSAQNAIEGALGGSSLPLLRVNVAALVVSPFLLVWRFR